MSKKKKEEPPVAEFGRPGFCVSKTELAKRLGVSLGTINNYVRAGLLPPPIKPTPQRCLWLETSIVAALKKLEEAATGRAA